MQPSPSSVELIGLERKKNPITQCSVSSQGHFWDEIGDALASVVA